MQVYGAPGPEPGEDRNALPALSGSFLLAALTAVLIVFYTRFPTPVELAIAGGAAVLAAIGLNYGSTMLHYTPSEIACTRFLGRILGRTGAPVSLEHLASVTYYERRDLLLTLRDAFGNKVEIDVSSPWPRIDEWGSLIEAAAFRRGVPLTDEVREILRCGYGRWTWAY